MQYLDAQYSPHGQTFTVLDIPYPIIILIESETELSRFDVAEQYQPTSQLNAEQAKFTDLLIFEWQDPEHKTARLLDDLGQAEQECYILKRIIPRPTSSSRGLPRHPAA